MIRPDETPKPWYTETAKQVTEGILHDKAYDRLPILADALEDGGCDDSTLLGILRTQSALQWFQDSGVVDRFAAGVVTWEQVSNAAVYLERLAEEFDRGVYWDYSELEFERAKMSKLAWMLGVLDSVVHEDETFHCSGYDNPNSTVEMWEAYSALRGEDPKNLVERYEYDGRVHEYPKSAFSCSC